MICTAPAKPAFPVRRGFTLLELMLSIAMVLVLIIGINFVFRAATDTVGAGNAINAANSDSQAAQGLLFDDFRDVVKDPPCFIIASQMVTQFLNAADATTSSNPTVMVTDNAGTTVNVGGYLPPPSGTGTTPYISPAYLNSRNHRADMVRFFARGFFPRRTAPDGSFISPTTAEDAFITLGHVALPTMADPPALTTTLVTNPTAFIGIGPTSDTTQALQRVGDYASNWVLGRSVMLLKDNGAITANDGTYYADPTNGGTEPYYSSTMNMAPLGYASMDSKGITANQSSRYDLAGMTIEQFRVAIEANILNWRTASYAGPVWWNALVYGLYPQTQTTPPYLPCLGNQANQTAPQTYGPISTPPYDITYYSGNPGYAFNYPSDPTQILARQQADPLVQQPLTAAAISGMSPYFLQHCSQFIVEYAGDYMQQDNDPPSTDAKAGAMTGLGPDGQIDYYLDANGNRHIRWYGMPRSNTGVIHPDTAPNPKGNVLIRGYDPTAGEDPTAAGVLNSSLAPLNYFTDVIPLRDYYSMYLNKGVANPPNLYAPSWEVDVNFAPTRDYGAVLSIPQGYPTGANPPTWVAFGQPQPTNTPTLAPATPNSTPSRYACAWYNDMPAMIRILIKVDDPNNQVKDGPWYEYVFRLK